MRQSSGAMRDDAADRLSRRQIPARRHAACQLGNGRAPVSAVQAPLRAKDTERNCAALSRGEAACSSRAVAAQLAEHQQVQIDASRAPAHARRRAPELSLQRCSALKNCSAGSWVSSAATALTKSGCSAAPRAWSRTALTAPPAAFRQASRAPPARAAPAAPVIEIAAEADVGGLPDASHAGPLNRRGGDAIVLGAAPPPAPPATAASPTRVGRAAPRWRPGARSAAASLRRLSTMAARSSPGRPPAAASTSPRSRPGPARARARSCSRSNAGAKARLLEQPQRPLATRMLQPRLQRVHLAHARARCAAECSRAPEASRSARSQASTIAPISCQRCGGSDSITCARSGRTAAAQTGTSAVTGLSAATRASVLRSPWTQQLLDQAARMRRQVALDGRKQLAEQPRCAQHLEAALAVSGQEQLQRLVEQARRRHARQQPLQSLDRRGAWPPRA